ncbi:MAG: nuclear transport factor 2 family protein [Bauldia litoralis]
MTRNAAPQAMIRNATAGILALMLATGFASAAAAADNSLESEARAAITAVFDALATGDPETVRPFIAPEFQLVRSDGAAYNKEEYLARSIPHIDSTPVINDLVVTRNGDIVVTRMQLQIEEELDGKKAESNAPQLIVFRVTDDTWQVVASANFARLAE